MSNSAEGDFLVKVTNIDGYFTTCTGGVPTVDTNETFNGGEQTSTIIIGKRKVSNVVVSRPYKPERDTQLCKQLRQVLPGFTTTVSKQPTLSAGSVIGDPTVWANAQLIRVTEPDANWGTSTAAMMELEFAVSSIT